MSGCADATDDDSVAAGCAGPLDFASLVAWPAPHAIVPSAVAAATRLARHPIRVAFMGSKVPHPACSTQPPLRAWLVAPCQPPLRLPVTRRQSSGPTPNRPRKHLRVRRGL